MTRLEMRGLKIGLAASHGPEGQPQFGHRRILKKVAARTPPPEEPSMPSHLLTASDFRF